MGKKLDSYICSGLVEIHSIKYRHDGLAKEMVKRGYHHNSPIIDSSSLPISGSVDSQKSYEELQFRCTECKKKN